MMSYQKHLTTIFLGFFYFSSVLGMNLSLFGSKKYDRVSDQVDAAQIAKLLGKSRLPKKKQVRLASYCENYPAACANKSLFSKIDPNLSFQNGDHVVRNYLKFLRKGSSEFVPLIIEALNHQGLNPHLLSLIQEDFALDILCGDDDKFMRMLMEHKNFNPNQRYGTFQEPLASILIKAKNFDALDLVVNHESFDTNVADLAGIRPAFYVLKDGREKERFLALMGELAHWSLSGLGLSDPRRLNILLRDMLTNNKDRLVIFKKYIEQIVMLNEVPVSEHANSCAVLTSLFQFDILGPKEYLDQDFTQQALAMLVHYDLLKENNEYGIYSSLFWFKDAIVNLDEINTRSLRKASQIHHAAAMPEEICTVCLEAYDGRWFTASKWCKHAICSSCWLESITSHNYEEDLLCPARGCGIAIPPSLYFALAPLFLENDDAYGHLLKAYEKQNTYYQAKRQSFLEMVPNMRTCSSCKADFMFDNKPAKPRKLYCPHCQTPHVLTDDAKNELSPITLSGIWGYCSECKTVIDKTSGCNAIHCTICQKNTYFSPL